MAVGSRKWKGHVNDKSESDFIPELNVSAWSQKCKLGSLRASNSAGGCSNVVSFISHKVSDISRRPFELSTSQSP